MVYIVQIRGGKAVLVNSAGTQDGPKLLRNEWIAGDQVEVESGNCRLLSRIPVNAIAIVKTFTPVGVLLVFPAHPAFQTILPIKQRVALEDRIAVHLDAMGRVHLLGCFSGGAVDDAAVVRCVYEPKTAPTFLSGVQGPSHYTLPYIDHSDLDTFTVDPACSVDLDDAITLDPVNKCLYVHIVDIHSGLIESAPGVEPRMFQNTCSLYLANEHTEHLLPAEDVERMSLNAGVPRRAISVQMKLDETDGSIKSYEIYPSTIRVKRRLNYSELLDLVSTEPYNWLHRLAQIKSDIITLAIPGQELRINSEGHIDRIVSVESNDAAHRMIAFAMIAANFTVSAHLRRKGVRVPNRFHEQITGVRESDVETVTGHPAVDSFLALKRWRTARYDLEEHGHFGLGLTDYVHFTSPMRRYADVLVHHLLAGVVYTDAWLSEAVDAINVQSLHVRGLQRYYTGVKVARHAPANVSTAFITGISTAGVLWYEPSLLLNGFTHVSAVGNGIRWKYEDGCLIGNSHTLKVGDQVKITSLAYNFQSGSYNAKLALNF